MSGKKRLKAYLKILYETKIRRESRNRKQKGKEEPLGSFMRNAQRHICLCFRLVLLQAGEVLKVIRVPS